MSVSADFLSSLTPPWLMRADFAIWETVFPLGSQEAWSSQTLIKQYGDPADKLIFILEGFIKIIALSMNGEQRSIGILGPGSILGEAAFFHNRQYKHDILCVTPCKGVSFAKEIIYEQILSHHPDIALYLFSNLASKSYMMSTQLECAAFMSREQILAHFLYHLGQEQEKKSWSYGLLSTLSLGKLAELLGMHRVTITKLMGSFRREGIVSMEERVRILDREKLLHILLE